MSDCVSIGPFDVANGYVPGKGGKGRGMAVKVAGSGPLRFHAKKSLSPSIWQIAHELVPLADSLDE